MIAHLDVDCFFAQVEELRLGVRGQPLGVQQNMEVAAVNYEARAFGLYNRISVAEALRRCPQLVLVRGDNGVNGMQRYRSAGQRVLRCVMQSLDALGLPTTWVGRRVERSSFDDYFIHLPESLASPEAASRWADGLRAAVLRDTDLRCSVGLARTKLLAMLATKRAKPNGLHCCFGAASESELLDMSRVDRICGAGLIGLRPCVRTVLQQALGETATIGDVRAWRERDPPGVAAALGDAEAADALGALLERACDGSVVGSFSLPRGLSVECSVRPSDHEPATSPGDLRRGFVHLAPLLLSRADEDTTTYGSRRPAHLIVKWKLFPSAKEVRQVQVPWPSDRSEASAEGLATLALRTFEGALRGQPFRISRAVLALTYADGAGASASAGRATTTGGAAGTAGKRKRAEAGQTSLLRFVKQEGASTAPRSPLPHAASTGSSSVPACPAGPRRREVLRATRRRRGARLRARPLRRALYAVRASRSLR